MPRPEILVVSALEAAIKKARCVISGRRAEGSAVGAMSGFCRVSLVETESLLHQ